MADALGAAIRVDLVILVPRLMAWFGHSGSHMSQLMHLSVMSSAISGRRVGLTGILALAEVAQQNAVVHVDLFGHRHVDHVAVARCGVDELALAVLHLLQVEAEVAFWGSSAPGCCPAGTCSSPRPRPCHRCDR